MVLRFLILAVLVAVFVAGLAFPEGNSACAQDAPKIEKLLPETGQAGSTVFIRGSGFTSQKEREHVFFGSTEAKVIVSTDSSIAVEVPQGSGSCPVSVVVDGKKSNEIPFAFGSGGEAEESTTISLTVSDPVADVGKTITGTFQVKGTKDPVRIHFTNDSPDVIALDGGNEQTVVTSGGEANEYTFPIHALSGPKHYTISYSWKTVSGEETVTRSGWEKISLSVKPRKGAVENSRPAAEHKGPTLARFLKIPQADRIVTEIIGRGRSAGKILDLRLTNNSDATVKTVIPFGLVLTPSDTGYQRMIVEQDTPCECPPHQTVITTLEGFCLDYGKKPPPGAEEVVNVSWSLPENQDEFISLVNIIRAGNHLAVSGKFSKKVHEPEKYRTEVIQRALWYSTTKETNNEAGKDALVKDIDEQASALPKEKQPTREEQKKVADSVWDDVNLTLKEAQEGQKRNPQ